MHLTVLLGQLNELKDREIAQQAAWHVVDTPICHPSFHAFSWVTEAVGLWDRVGDLSLALCCSLRARIILE